MPTALYFPLAIDFLETEPLIEGTSQEFSRNRTSPEWRNWHTQQTQNLTSAFSVLFEILHIFMKQRNKTTLTRSGSLQVFSSISMLFEEIFTQFFTQ